MDFIADSQLIPVLRNGDLPVGSLSAVERYLLDNIDGKRTVEQLGDMCGLELDMAGRMVGKLLKAGVLHANDAGARATDLKTDSHQKASEKAPADTGDCSSAVDASRDAIENAVSELFLNLEKSNYYKLLGISPDAERAEIRAAYFSLSKKFHPDTHFLNDDAAFKEKLNRVFDKLTVAYDTLSGKSKRKKYDESIASELEIWQMEHSLRKSVQAASQKQTAGNSSGTGTAVNGSHGISGSAGGRRQTLSERLSAVGASVSNTSYRRTPVQDDVVINLGARISRAPVTRTSYSAGTPATVQSEEAAEYNDGPSDSSPVPGGFSGADADSLTSEQLELRRQQWKRERLKKAMGSVPPTSFRRAGGGMTSESENELAEQARLAMEQHQYEHAIHYIQELLRRDGENAAAAELLRQAQSGKLKTEINELIRRGRHEQSQGNMQTALELYERAYKLDIRNDDAKYHIASLLLEVRKDLRRALQLCREIVSTGAKKPQYYVTLADLYELTNERGRALQAIHRALELTPEDQMLRNRLKSMSKK